MGACVKNSIRHYNNAPMSVFFLISYNFYSIYRKGGIHPTLQVRKPNLKCV